MQDLNDLALLKILKQRNYKKLHLMEHHDGSTEHHGDKFNVLLISFKDCNVENNEKYLIDGNAPKIDELRDENKKYLKYDDKIIEIYAKSESIKKYVINLDKLQISKFFTKFVIQYYECKDIETMNIELPSPNIAQSTFNKFIEYANDNPFDAINYDSILTLNELNITNTFGVWYAEYIDHLFNRDCYFVDCCSMQSLIID